MKRKQATIAAAQEKNKKKEQKELKPSWVKKDTRGKESYGGAKERG